MMVFMFLPQTEIEGEEWWLTQSRNVKVFLTAKDKLKTAFVYSGGPEWGDNGTTYFVLGNVHSLLNYEDAVFPSFQVELAGEFDDVSRTANYELTGRFTVTIKDEYDNVGREDALEMIELITR